MPFLNLDIPIINACGIGSYLDIFQKLEEKNASFGAWVPKSIGPYTRDPTLQQKWQWGKEKTGNPNPVVVHTGSVLLNSMALPTHAVESWIDEFKSTPLNKPIIGSVYGYNPEDYSRLISMVDPYVSAWELNVSCPNKEKGECSVRESMTSQITEIVNAVQSSTQKSIIAKLSVNEDYKSIAEIVKNKVDYIACSNTVGPGLVIDIYSKHPVLAGIYGGLSGPAIKPLAVKMVHDVYSIVKENSVKIIAYGGINQWEDIIEYALAGASIFGLGTGLISIDHNQQVRAKTTDEIVTYSQEIWTQVKEFEEKHKMTLKNLTGQVIL